jgi:hypothetical protein
MTEDDLKSAIIDGLKSRETAFGRGHALLREFAAGGGTSDAAQRVLYEIRAAVAADEAVEDTVLDLLDCVVGWCGPHARIW